MGATFKGYNGFPNLSTFNFLNVGETLAEILDVPLSVWDNTEIGRTNVFRQVGGGTVLDFSEIVKNTELMSKLGAIVHGNRNTWVKAYDGVYINEPVIVSDNQTSFSFYFSDREMINFQGIEHDEGDQTMPVYVDLSPSAITPEVFKPYLAILNFDSLINPYEAPPHIATAQNVYKWVVGNGNKATTGSVSTFNAISPVPTRYEMGFDPDTHLPIIEHRYTWLVGQVEYSGDDYNDFWCYSSYGSTSTAYSNMTYFESWGGAPMDSDTDYSGGGGGGGTYDDRSDPVPFDGVPTVTASMSGFVKLYYATIGNLQSMKNFLYSNSFIDNVAKLLNNPLDYIISLMLYPCAPDLGENTTIGLGGIDTEISCREAVQYKTIDCGSINVEEKFGSFMDYDNMTQVSIFCPFCGVVKLDTNVVMHSTVNLKYTIDFLTGDCVARIGVSNNHGVNAEFYEKEGNCACQIPMSGANYMSFYAGAFKSVMGAGLSLGAGNVGGAVASAVNGVAGMKVERERVGGISGNHGFIAQYVPYIIIERPVQNYPENFNHVIGRSSNIGGLVGDFSGYTEVREVDLSGVVATENELVEIRNILESGVYI